MKIVFQDSGRDLCPFCGASLPPNETSEHVKRCPVLWTEREIAVVPGRVPYEEGELPDYLKEIIRRKGSFLNDDVDFVG